MKVRQGIFSLQGIVSRDEKGYKIGEIYLLLDRFLGKEMNVIVEEVIDLPPVDPEAWRNCGDG